VTDNLLLKRSFFYMGYNILSYALNTPKFNHYLIQKLVLHLCDYYTVFGRIEPNIHSCDDIKIVSYINYVTNHSEESLMTAHLISCASRFYTSGFYYDNAYALLEQALELAMRYDNNSAVLSHIYYSFALYWDRCGDHAETFALLQRAHDVTQDEDVKSFLMVYGAYELCLLDEVELCDKLLDNVDCHKFSDYSLSKIYHGLICCFKNVSFLFAEQEILRTESVLHELNIDHTAALNATLYYAYSHLYANFGQPRKCNSYYRKYINVISIHFTSTDGGVVIQKAVKILQKVEESLKVYDSELDELNWVSLDIENNDYAASVKIVVALAYALGLRSQGYYALSKIYLQLGYDIAASLIPDAETTEFLKKMFDGEVPACLTEDSLYFWDYLELTTILLEHPPMLGETNEELYDQLNYMTRMYPSKSNYFELIKIYSNYVYDVKGALRDWKNVVENAQDDEERYHLCIDCSRYASAIGMIYESKEFFDLALETRYYRSMNSWSKTKPMLEQISITEKCGQRSFVDQLFHVSASTTRGTELFPKVIQAWAYTSFEREDWHNAKKLLELCLKTYIPEEALYDENLCSLYTYLSVVSSYMGDYQEAYDYIMLAQKYLPQEGEGWFQLKYDEAYYLCALMKAEQSRVVLKEAELLAADENERNMVYELYEKIAMKREERERYFESIVSDQVYNDIDIDDLL